MSKTELDKLQEIASDNPAVFNPKRIESDPTKLLSDEEILSGLSDDFGSEDEGLDIIESFGFDDSDDPDDW